MSSKCGKAVAKWTLVFFNLVFIVLSIPLLYIGISNILNVTNFADLYKDITNVLSVAIVAIGSIMLLFSLFGFMAALRESSSFLSVYSYTLVLMVVIELVAVGCVFIFKSQLEQLVEGRVVVMMAKYNWTGSANPDNAVIDDFQMSMGCCGATSYEDWNMVRPTNLTTDDSDYPMSCCVRHLKDLRRQSNCPVEVASKEIGCVKAIQDVMHEGQVPLLAVGASMLVSQFVGILLSGCLGRKLRVRFMYG